MGGKIEIKGLEELRGNLDPKLFRGAFRSAVNKCARDGFNITKKRVAQIYNVKVMTQKASGVEVTPLKNSSYKETGVSYIRPKGKMGKKVDKDGRYGKVRFGWSNKGGKRAIEIYVHATQFPDIYFIKGFTPGNIEKLLKNKHKKPIKISVKKNESVILNHAFFAKANSGHIGVFSSILDGKEKVKSRGREVYKRQLAENSKWLKHDKFKNNKKVYKIREHRYTGGATMFEVAGIYENLEKSFKSVQNEFWKYYQKGIDKASYHAELKEIG